MLFLHAKTNLRPSAALFCSNDYCGVFQRKYHLTLIDKFLSDAFDSLSSIEGT